jgi:biopolymer transport protein ExbB
MQGFAKFLHDGGTLMYFNVIVSVIVLSIIADRTIFFLVKSSVNARAFLENIRKLVLANNLDRAVKLCSATSAPVALVAKAGLQRFHRGEIAVAQAIEEALVDATPMLKKRIQILWSLANIATLIGLLGTVAGLIRAFAAVGSAAPELRSKLLADGIAEALNNTAQGLGIAVTSWARCPSGRPPTSRASRSSWKTCWRNRRTALVSSRNKGRFQTGTSAE